MLLWFFAVLFKVNFWYNDNYNWSLKMIASLVAVSVLPFQIACTNCNGVGYFEVACPRCAGAGLVDPPKSTKFTRGAFDRWVNGKIPCPDCLRGLSSKGKRGTGKKKVTCKVCWGRKKIRK